LRDIPAFTTQNGLASLTLSEIPYTHKAYIRIHDSQHVKDFLDECCSFCRAIGAQEIYAAGHEYLANYPLQTKILRMCRMRENLPDTDAALLPMQQKTLDQWRNLYNERMHGIDNCAYMTHVKAEEYLEKGNAYFIHQGDTLLGFGAASEERVEALGSVVPGSGEDILLALNHALTGERICVEVATSNTRAMRLYQRLGFFATEELSVWYKII
jgi:hypothetical protein